MGRITLASLIGIVLGINVNVPTLDHVNVFAISITFFPGPTRQAPYP